MNAFLLLVSGNLQASSIPLPVTWTLPSFLSREVEDLSVLFLETTNTALIPKGCYITDGACHSLYARQILVSGNGENFQ